MGLLPQLADIEAEQLGDNIYQKDHLRRLTNETNPRMTISHLMEPVSKLATTLMKVPKLLTRSGTTMKR